MAGVQPGKPEQRTFIGGTVKYEEPQGCCSSPHTKRCCLATGVLGGLFLLLGLIVMVAGKGLLQGAILRSMALKEGSGRTETWLMPEKADIGAHLTGYGFHVENPEEVAQGAKPRLKEVGPFVYQALTIKDTVEKDGSSNIHFNEDGQTLTYSPRRFYFLDREKSVGDPDTTFLTVPNIPMLTGFHKIRGSFSAGVAASVIAKTGRGTPFVNVSFTGLLWGYEDDMPCINLQRPQECPPPAGEVDIFAVDEDDDGGWGDDDDDDWKRKKREAPEYLEEEEDWGRVKREAVNKWKTGVKVGEDVVAKVESFKTADFAAMLLPKMEYLVSEDEQTGEVQCDCQWGLFRDRNVTLREAIKMHTGVADIEMKGRMETFKGSPSMNWWKPGSQCDNVVGAQDGATLPPGLPRDKDLDIFIALMCRRITLEYEADKVYKGLTSLRFVPPRNAMGSHTDPDPEARNEDNSCFCMEEEGFPCFKSGVMNMGPCKKMPGLPTGAPISLSYPHFYQADQSFRDAVEGMKPEKEKHQFFVDISPEFGFPLAFRPRFQLNAVIRRDENIPLMSNFVEELVLPFLWAQDGFGEPSDAMAEAIKFGISAPDSLPLLGGSVLLVLGGGMVLTSLAWVLWQRRLGKGEGSEMLPMS